MSENRNDSPAFRLRPRSEPKSYYTIRLEYSANPAAFTRERPRSTLTKGRLATTKTSYSKSKSKVAYKKPTSPYDQKGGLQGNQLVQAVAAAAGAAAVNVITKEDMEREERRKQLQRELSQSITTRTMISPFLQRQELLDLKPSSVYDQNYITLKVETVTRVKQQASSMPSEIVTTSDSETISKTSGHIICMCSGTDSATKNVNLYVHMYNEFAREDLVKVNKIMSLAKFRTGPLKGSANYPEAVNSTGSGDEHKKRGQIGFDVIVKFDESISSLTDTSSGAGRKRPVIPYVCITDMIEEPAEPYVEMNPKSPPPTQQPQTCIPNPSGVVASTYTLEEKFNIVN